MLKDTWLDDSPKSKSPFWELFPMTPCTPRDFKLIDIVDISNNVDFRISMRGLQITKDDLSDQLLITLQHSNKLFCLSLCNKKVSQIKQILVMHRTCLVSS